MQFLNVYVVVIRATSRESSRYYKRELQKSERDCASAQTRPNPRRSQTQHACQGNPLAKVKATDPPRTKPRAEQSMSQTDRMNPFPRQG